MKEVILKVAPLAPSKGIIPEEVIDQFNWRKTGVFKGKSFVGLCADLQEPIWWNRPLISDVLCKKEDDGIYSFNLPFCGGRDTYKSGYNILVNKNSIPIISQLKLDKEEGSKQAHLLSHFLLRAIYNALLELGVDKKKLVLTRNDLLYDGKKFVGGEECEHNGWFEANYILTLHYTPEKDTFARLTGKYALSRGITGIIEETNCFTKEQLVECLLKHIEKQLSIVYK